MLLLLIIVDVIDSKFLLELLLIMLVDACHCQCCYLLMFVCLPFKKTLVLLLNLVNQESEM